MSYKGKEIHFKGGKGTDNCLTVTGSLFGCKIYFGTLFDNVIRSKFRSLSNADLPGF